MNGLEQKEAEETVSVALPPIPSSLPPFLPGCISPPLPHQEETRRKSVILLPSLPPSLPPSFPTWL